jgi:hypothetical protein
MQLAQLLARAFRRRAPFDSDALGIACRLHSEALHDWHRASKQVAKWIGWLTTQSIANLSPPWIP